jgi:hypothetical protein
MSCHQSDHQCRQASPSAQAAGLPRSGSAAAPAPSVADRRHFQSPRSGRPAAFVGQPDSLLGPGRPADPAGRSSAPSARLHRHPALPRPAAVHALAVAHAASPEAPLHLAVAAQLGCCRLALHGRAAHSGRRCLRPSRGARASWLDGRPSARGAAALHQHLPLRGLGQHQPRQGAVRWLVQARRLQPVQVQLRALTRRPVLAVARCQRPSSPAPL